MITLVLVVAFAEVYFRRTEPQSPEGTSYGVPITLNSDGFRDREYAIPKPAGVYRVALMGDSFAWGIGLQEEETLARQLETMLNEQVDGDDIEVVNATKPGSNTLEQLQILQETVLKYEPDMVLLIYNINDVEYTPQFAPQERQEADASEGVDIIEIDPEDEIGEISGWGGLRTQVRIWEGRSAFMRYLVPRLGIRLRRWNIIDDPEFSWVQQVYAAYDDENVGWADAQWALGEMSEVTHEHDIDFLVAVYPLLNELEDYQGDSAHQSVLGVCRREDIPCIDLLYVFEYRDERDFWINRSDGHPNAEAQYLVASALYPIILLEKEHDDP